MTILMLETIHNDAMPVLEKAGPVIMSPTPDALGHDLPFADITAIITRGIGQLDRTLMDKCPNLSVVARCGAGLNNVDLQAAAEKNIAVVHAPGLNATAVAEHTMMLILMSIRRGFSNVLEVKHNNWDWRSDYNGDDVCKKNICIIGGGNIGGRVAKLCEAFSMNVNVCGRNGNGIQGLKKCLMETLPRADVVSLHIPLATDTRGLFDKKLLSQMKPGAVLINTARGELVDTGALLHALDEGSLAHYAADVVADETPVQDDPLTTHHHAIITSHVASLTERTYREMSLFTANNVASVLQGANPNTKAIYRGAA